jgi:hypothetical protein
MSIKPETVDQIVGMCNRAVPENTMSFDSRAQRFVLYQKPRLVLSQRDFEMFVATLEADAAPSEKLKALMRG